MGLAQASAHPASQPATSQTGPARSGATFGIVITLTASAALSSSRTEATS